MIEPAGPSTLDDAMVDLPIAVLGYDARLLSCETGQTVSSADPEIWTSITEEDESQTWSGFQYLWSNLAELTQRLNTEPSTLSFQIIAVARLTPILEVTDQDWAFYAGKVFAKSSLAAVTPYFANSTWSLLGYDVCDYYLWSGLHRAPMDPKDQSSCLSRALKELNCKGLLTSFDSARALATELTETEQQRAPYFPYALFASPLTSLEDIPRHVAKP